MKKKFSIIMILTLLLAACALVGCKDKVYTITFKDFDGSVLQTGELKSGTTPKYNGEAPAREATDECEYVFSGWSPEITAVSGDAEYVAQYARYKHYVITFKNHDGTTLQSGIVREGETPEYTQTLSKASTAEYEYVFAGWSPEITAVSGKATYTAQFDENKRTYTITFKNYDDAVLQNDAFEYGTTPEYTKETPIQEDDAENEYVFVGWSPEIAVVSGEAEYTASFEAFKINTYQSGDGSKDDPYIIKTPKQLKLFADTVNGGEKYTGAYFALDADIDLGGAEWTPIGISSTAYFEGDFDGNRFKITNYKITALAAGCFAGFFGFKKGMIQNLGIEDFSINISGAINRPVFGGMIFIGGFAGLNSSGGINNCYAVGEIVLNATISHNLPLRAGGLVGYVDFGWISDTYAEVDVDINVIAESDTYYHITPGGLIGASGYTFNSYATGNINVTFTQATPDINFSAVILAGGLIGIPYDQTVNCYATGDINILVPSGGNTAIRASGLIGDSFWVTTKLPANCYRFDGQNINVEKGHEDSVVETNEYGTLCDAEMLSSASFFTADLKWDPAIWDFSDLDFENGKHPKLK